MPRPADPARRAASSTVYDLFADKARRAPGHVAVETDGLRLDYATLLDRVARLHGVLAARGVGRGDRVAVLSENRAEYLETILAAARSGAIVACQNWRLADVELDHCLDLVEPRAVLSSPTLAHRVAAREPLVFGESYETLLAHARRPAPATVDPEDGLLILYTSGTTGLPKGAVVSHRAQIARDLVVRADLGIAPSDTFVAWSPMYHMGGTEYSLGTLMGGGKVVVVDGFDADALALRVESEPLGWLLLMPGTVGRLADVMERRRSQVAGVKLCGVMADLVPPSELARITRLLDAPYANTFGATETGNPPASAGVVPIGVAPTTLPKTQSACCEVRLVDAAGRDVPDGDPGELIMRGPTLFSGYWADPEATAEAFGGGWYHMGDVFRRNKDGKLDFVDRVKYLIKSGGENVYPAEIERVLLADPRVAEAAVVRRPDQGWGEVPVAFVARRDPGLSEGDLVELCRQRLAGYKRPAAFLFIEQIAFPRNATGKILRQVLEQRLSDTSTGDP